jgi:hypothetical protein
MNQLTEKILSAGSLADDLEAVARAETKANEKLIEEKKARLDESRQSRKEMEQRLGWLAKQIDDSNATIESSQQELHNKMKRKEGLMNSMFVG